jgi:taurine dioxygenase
VDAGDFWHSDSSHHEEPCNRTVLYAVRNPSRGGATEFCNMYQVYDALPPDLKQGVEGRYGIHHISKITARPIQCLRCEPKNEPVYYKDAEGNTKVAARRNDYCLAQECR